MGVEDIFKRARKVLRAGATAGLILSGETSAQAVDHSKVKKDSWQPALEQLIPKPHTLSKDQFEKANQLSEEVAHLTEKLAWNNEYGRALKDPNLTANTLADIIDEASKISAKLTRANFAVDVGLKHYLEAGQSKALAQIGMFDDKGEYSVCNGTFVSVPNDPEYVYFVTANHCAAGELTVQIGKQIYSAESFQAPQTSGEDVSVLQLPKEVAVEAIPLNNWANNDFLHGQVAIIDATEVTGERITYPTIYIKMTIQTYRVMFQSEPDLNDPYTKTILDGYWFVLPPALGEWRRDEKGHIMREPDGSPIVKFQGESGTSPRVLVPGIGDLLGGVFSQGYLNQLTKECRDHKRALCTAVGFAAGVDPIAEAILDAKKRSLEDGPLVSPNNF